MNLQMKRFIRAKVKEKLKPSRILNAMIDAWLFAPEDDPGDMLRPVTRYAYNYRTSRLSDNNDLDATEHILSSHPYHPSLPDTASFAFGYTTDESGNPTLSRGTAERPVVMGFSTKAMLRNLAHADTHILHIDATFKLNTADFPSVIIGVSDVRRQFHPVACFIISDT